MSRNKTIVSKIGEFGLIDQLAGLIKTDSRVIKGIGDDTAVVKRDSRNYLLLTTDMLAEAHHFTKSIGAKAIGYKALGCSVSDIAAMGGIPSVAVVSMGLPPRLKVGFVEDMYKGMLSLAKKYNIQLVGGDTIANEKIVINVTLLGRVRKGHLTLRSNAKKGDEIFVSGPLGNSLKTGKHCSFSPRLKESQFLVKHFKPSAMIDISDGLAGDLKQILKASQVGAYLYGDRIPKTKGASLKSALHEGEDFELLFTLSSKKANKLKAQKNVLFKFYCIGEIVDRKEELKLVDSKGKKTNLSGRGFTHF